MRYYVTEKNVTQYAYDSMNRVKNITNALNVVTSYTYNSDGLLEEEVNGREQKRNYKYDALGRVIEIKDEASTISYTYDANGNFLTVKDKQGTIKRTYDALNRVKTYTDYNGNTITYGYVCRTFDQLYAGDDYSEAKLAIHIGFLCFTPFKESPEFYAKYKLLNVKTYQVYSDKFELRVVDLKHTELATEEDRQYQIDYWAALFMAKTWEDLKMIAQQNEFMQEATETLYELNADETIRQQCLAKSDITVSFEKCTHFSGERLLAWINIRLKQQKGFLSGKKRNTDSYRELIQ